MAKRKLSGVQHLPRNIEIIDCLWATISDISQQRQTCFREMSADLVSTTGNQLHFDQADRIQSLEKVIMGLSFLAATSN